MFWRHSIWVFCFAAVGAVGQIQQQTLKLVDGSTIVGRIVAPKNEYLQVALDSGGAAPMITNIFWARLSQETLRSLLTNRTTAPFATIFLDPPAQQARPAVTAKKITIKPPPRLDRPQDGSLVASPVMLVLLLIIDAANLYAGWEIGVFRQWPPAVVALIAAVVPIIGPAIFLAMPTHRVRTDEAPLEAAATEEAAIVTEEAPPAAVEEHSAKPALPETVTYPRGQFTFNRRFFETKFAGFLKMVPGEAERDKVIFIKSARGEYTGHRFSKVEPNEVFLQIRKGTATEEVMIPFSEIYEVQIRHKDA